MGIGFSIFLLAVGAVLTFAVDAAVNGVDLQVVGVILMIAGVIGLAIDMAIFAPRRRSTVVTRDSYADAPAGTRVVRRDEIV